MQGGTFKKKNFDLHIHYESSSENADAETEG